jgi:hypothetical protein
MKKRKNPYEMKKQKPLMKYRYKNPYVEMNVPLISKDSINPYVKNSYNHAITAAISCVITQF